MARRTYPGTLSAGVAVLTHGLLFNEQALCEGAAVLAMCIAYAIGFPIGWKVSTYYVSKSYKYRTAAAHQLTSRLLCGAAWAGFLGVLAFGIVSAVKSG